MKASSIIYVVLILALILLISVQVLKKHNKPKTYILGQQYANAIAKEQQRIANGDVGPSPLPQARYISIKGERNLLNPIQAKIDNDLESICKQFISLSAEKREKYRKNISLDDIYTLLYFAKRCSVFSMRNNNTNILRIGFSAIAMIEEERTDYRDIIVAVSVLCHAAKRLNLNPSQELTDAANLSEPNVRDLLLGFSKQLPKEQDICEFGGFKEVIISSGIGFTGLEFHEYRPKIDLLSIILNIADKIDNDKYMSNSPIIASCLPEVWFGKKRVTEVQKALADVRAAVSISAELDKQFNTNASDQLFIVFLAEMAREESSAKLLEIVRSERPKDYSLLGLAYKRLFCLIVAESTYIGVESFEKEDSLRRFESDIEMALKRGYIVSEK